MSTLPKFDSFEGLTVYKIGNERRDMLDRLRSRLASRLADVGKAFSRVSPVPTVWTLVGLAAMGLSGLSYAGRYHPELLGGLLILLSGWFDIVDGAVARVTGRTTDRGAFLDSNLDRVGEVAVFAGILVGGHANPLATLLALSASLLVSYSRAKGDSLGVSLRGIGIGERSERLLILAVLSIVGEAWWGVALVALVASATFIERAVRGAMQLRPGGERPPYLK